LADKAFISWTGEHPEFFAKAILFARKYGYKRTVPITALAYLSRAENKAFFRLIFDQVIWNLDNLLEFMEVIFSGQVRKVGSCIRKAVSLKLNMADEYQFVKYGSKGKSTNLADVIHMCSPKPLDRTREAMFYYALTDYTRLLKKYGEDFISKNLPVIYGYEKFKVTKDLSLVAKHKLPYEVVTSVNSTPEAWDLLLHNSPALNMLRNLRNFRDKGVLENPENVKFIVDKLSSVDWVTSNRILPHQIFAGYSSLEKIIPAIETALETALENSISNLQQLPGDTYVSLDVSGSMHTTKLSTRSSISCLDVGGLLAISLSKLAAGGAVGDIARDVSRVHFTVFDTECRQPDLNLNTPTLQLNAELIKIRGGGTDLGSSIRYLIKNKINVATAILITDFESWSDWASNSPVAKAAISEYRRKVNLNTKFFFVQLVPVGTSQVPQHFENCYFVYGWNDSVIQFIANHACNRTQIDSINAIRLSQPTTTEIKRLADGAISGLGVKSK
jgi:60 kDa SS-A/Ro ribonucleoprotein